jgi:hypothetical protein
VLREQSNTSRASSCFAPQWRFRSVFCFAGFVVLAFAGIAASLANDQPQAGRHFAREPNFVVPQADSGDDASDEKAPPDAVRANADDIETIVLTADAQPAANARIVAASVGSEVLVTNGKFDRFSSYPFHWRTDRKGRFYAPASQADAWLAVMHPAGYAVYKPAAQAKHRNIVLDPWSRVEGRFRSGSLPAAGTRLMIARPDINRRVKGEPLFLMTSEATTGSGGQFLFERVPAGKGWISADDRIMHRATDSGMASTYVVRAQFLAGKTVHVDVATTGRSIIGSLQMPPGLEKEAEWRFAKIQLHANRLLGTRGHPHFFAIVNNKGLFRLDDVPPDEYTLTIVAVVGSRVRSLEKTFSVPRAEGAVASPLDLGVLTLPEK